MENENGKIGEMEKKGMEKCGWTAGEAYLKAEEGLITAVKPSLW